MSVAQPIAPLCSAFIIHHHTAGRWPDFSVAVEYRFAFPASALRCSSSASPLCPLQWPPSQCPCPCPSSPPRHPRFPHPPTLPNVVSSPLLLLPRRCLLGHRLPPCVAPPVVRAPPLPMPLVARHRAHVVVGDLAELNPARVVSFVSKILQLAIFHVTPSVAKSALFKTTPNALLLTILVVCLPFTVVPIPMQVYWVRLHPHLRLSLECLSLVAAGC